MEKSEIQSGLAPGGVGGFFWVLGSWDRFWGGELTALLYWVIL